MAFLAPIYAGLGAAGAATTVTGVMGTTSAIAATGAKFLPLALTAPTGGGLLAGLTTAYETIKPTADLLYKASQGLSFIQSMQQGQIMKDQYRLQELQALSDMETMKFNATMDGLDRLDKLKRIQAANIATSSARGVDGLSGSALLNQIVSDQEYGKDYKLNLMNLQNIASRGNVNADIYGAASKRAPVDAMLDAGVKLGEAAYSYKKLYG